MKLHNQKEVYLYALYLGFGLTRLSAYQAVSTLRHSKRLMAAKGVKK